MTKKELCLYLLALFVIALIWAHQGEQRLALSEEMEAGQAESLRNQEASK